MQNDETVLNYHSLTDQRICGNGQRFSPVDPPLQQLTATVSPCSSCRRRAGPQEGRPCRCSPGTPRCPERPSLRSWSPRSCRTGCCSAWSGAGCSASGSASGSASVSGSASCCSGPQQTADRPRPTKDPATEDYEGTTSIR